MAKFRIFKRRVIDDKSYLKLLRVRYSEGEPYRQSRIIAAQLKVLAVNTDGRPTIAGAYDAEFLDRGMRFRFSTTTKRDEFKGRVENYLSQTVTKRLTYSA